MFKRKILKPNLAKTDIKALSRLLGVKSDENFFIFTSKYRPLKTNLKRVHYNYTYENDVYILLGSLKDENKTFKNKYGKEVFDTKASNIKYIPALMIDIDSHRFGLNEDVAKEISKTLVNRLENDYEIDLVPDEISYTGRGLQLFYNVNEYDRSKRKIVSLAKDLRKLIVGELEIIINELNEFFSDLGIRTELEIDNSTSSNRQLFRCPGFINTKSGKEAHFLYVHDREKRIVMGEYINELKQELGIRPTGRKYVKFNIKRKFHSINELHNKRGQDTLAYLFRHGKGVRHKCYTNLITIKLNRGDSKEEIVRSLSEIDSILEDSYFKSDKEIEREVEYIVRYWKNKSNGIIKVSNENMIEYLGISDEELEEYQWQTFGKSSKKKVKRISMEEIIKLWKEDYSITTIARMLDCSRTTVYKYVNVFKNLRKEQRQELLLAVESNKDGFYNILCKILNISYIDNLNRAKVNTYVENLTTKDKLIEWQQKI